MFRTFFLIFSLFGLTAFSVLTEDRGSAETYACQVAPVCLPETPPPCETIPCVHQKQMTDPVMRHPEVFRTDSMLCRWCSLRMSCAQ